MNELDLFPFFWAISLGIPTLILLVIAILNKRKEARIKKAFMSLPTVAPACPTCLGVGYTWKVTNDNGHVMGTAVICSCKEKK